MANDGDFGRLDAFCIFNFCFMRLGVGLRLMPTRGIGRGPHIFEEMSQCEGLRDDEPELIHLGLMLPFEPTCGISPNRSGRTHRADGDLDVERPSAAIRSLTP